MREACLLANGAGLEIPPELFSSANGVIE